METPKCFRGKHLTETLKVTQLETLMFPVNTPKNDELSEMVKRLQWNQLAFPVESCMFPYLLETPKFLTARHLCL